MVRQIRLCASCGETRFISLHLNHWDCGECASSAPPSPKKQPTATSAYFQSPAASSSDAASRSESTLNHPDSTEIRKNPPVFDLYDDDTDDEDAPLESLLKQPGDREVPASEEIPQSHGDTQSRGDEKCIDLLSSEEEEDEDADEPVLADFLSAEEEGNETDQQSPRSSLASNVEGLHDVHAKQQELHGGATLSTKGDQDQNNNDNKDLSVCFICGLNLMKRIKSGYNGRLNHIKRCSKSHGVTAKDVRYNDDHELFTDDQQKQPAVLSANNPYHKHKTHWHGQDDTAAAAAPKASAPTACDMLMAGARRAAKTAQIRKKSKEEQKSNGGFKRRRYNSFGNNNYSSTSCPSFKKIPGTDFNCDGFQHANANVTQNYFLTHFHSDHYGGITKGWNVGTIYCSSITANLVNSQLGVDRQYLHPLPMLEPTVIESKGKPVTVTLLQANHCPGAVMFLFQVGQRVILHVGDFRWNYGIMSSQAPLRPYCRQPWTKDRPDKLRIDDLFLDTTYCGEHHKLPTQRECIDAAVETAVREVKQAQADRKRILLLFGAYTIGKEQVYMSVAQHLGLKVYVDKRRHKILSSLEWKAEQLDILTTEPQDTILWVVPLGHVNLKRLPAYQSIRMRKFQRDFDRVVGFRPTGWSLSKKKNASSIVGTTSRGDLTVHSVPYSEHSSFPELIECLECLNPVRIVPTVDVSKSQQQKELLMSHWRDRQAGLV